MPAFSDDFIGYLKYQGRLVESGIIDARAAARALNGFDSALRFFIAQENPEIAAAALPIPVYIERNSWTAFIPHDLIGWIKTALGAGATVYATTAAKKLAETDFEGVGITTLFRRALAGVQWSIRIGKHLGDFSRRTFASVAWRNDNTEIGIRNDQGEILFVPREYLELFQRAPRALLRDIATVVEIERTLTVGIKDGNIIEEEAIGFRDRSIFVFDELPESDTLFPEMVHEQNVILDGLVTKGNEKENSIGFEYDHHVLTCYPRSGSMVRFKPHLFLQCRIYGTIDRSDGHGGISSGRPKITFDDLQILSAEEPELF